MRKPRSVREVLRRMKELLKKPGSWIRGHAARMSPRGPIVDPESPCAKCFCLEGALRHVSPYRVGFRMTARRVIKKAWTKLHPKSDDRFSIPTINDSFIKSHSEMLKLLDTAIKEKTR